MKCEKNIQAIREASKISADVDIRLAPALLSQPGKPERNSNLSTLIIT